MPGGGARFAARVWTRGGLPGLFPEQGVEPYVREAVESGARVFKAHVQVGAYYPADALLHPACGLLAEAPGGPFSRRAPPRLAGIGDRILFGSDVPNLPYPYLHQLHALERLGLGDDWLRAVCHDNGAQLFGV